MKYLLSVSAAIALTAMLSTSGHCAAAAAPNGAALYTSSCSCHGSLAGSQKAGASAAMITGAIGANTGGMGMLKGLSAADIQAIAAALGGSAPAPSAGSGSPAPSPAPNPAPTPAPSAGGAPSGTPSTPSPASGGGGPSAGGAPGNAPEGMSGNCSACHPNGVPGSGKSGAAGDKGGMKSGTGSGGGREGRRAAGQASGNGGGGGERGDD